MPDDSFFKPGGWVPTTWKDIAKGQIPYLLQRHSTLHQLFDFQPRNFDAEIKFEVFNNPPPLLAADPLDPSTLKFIRTPRIEYKLVSTAQIEFERALSRAKPKQRHAMLRKRARDDRRYQRFVVPILLKVGLRYAEELTRAAFR